MIKHHASALSLKAVLKDFYKDCREETKKNLEKLLAVTFKDYYDDVCDCNHWGQVNNAVCLATMCKLKFKIVLV